MSKLWKNNKNGVIGTILFHLVLILIFVFFGFTAPPPEFPEPDGILIDFGDSETGLGDVEPESVENSNPNVNNNAENVEEEILTDDNTETVAVENNVEENNNDAQENDIENEEVDPEINNNGLYQGSNNTNEGDTEGDGNMGDPDGADTDNYTGGDGGNGINFDLNGRSAVGKFPKPKYPPGNVYGKVILKIKVDKYGKVISVSEAKGTTATDEGLIRSAKQAAWKVKFNKDFNSIEQVGTITYDFSLM